MTDNLGKEPSGLAPAALGSAFARPDRAAGLRNLALQKRPTQAAAPVVDTPGPVVAEGDSEVAPTVEAPKTNQAERPNKAALRRSAATSPTVIYLPASLHERLRSRSEKAAGTTYTEILLDALDELHGDLAELLVDVRSGRKQGSLFQGRDRQRQRHDEPQVQVTFRPTRSDLGVIDKLVRDHKVSSRSTFVARVLDAYLT